MRYPKLIIILGYNGTGKTTLAKKLLLSELKKKNGRGLVLTPDDIEWGTLQEINGRFPDRIESYVKARKLIYYDGCLLDIQNNFRKGLLIFDDIRAYSTAMTPQDLHNLLIRRRQKEIDIICVGHGFTEVPPKFFTFASEIILFNTKDNISMRKDVLKDFEKMEEAQKRVNEKALNDPYYFEIIKQ